MLDATMRRLIDPPLNRVGRVIAACGATADGVTLVGVVLGITAAVMIAFGLYWVALVPLLLSRLADGLDGAVARATKRTDYGGYLDITCDFLVYGAIPVGFVMADPARNGAAGAFLLMSFLFNGASFLGYAIMAERHGMETRAQGIKSLYYSAAMLEGTETILFFVAICLFPAQFFWLAWVFGGLCILTAVLRLAGARNTFPRNL